MPMFRKKPVTIEAIQWTGHNLQEVLAFTGKHPKWDEWFEDWKAYEKYVRQNGDIFKIKTLEGTMDASPMDWIIRGVNGEHYPCKPDIFEKTYEPADLCATPDPRTAALVEALEYGERMCRLDFHRHINKDSDDFSQAVWGTWQRMLAALAAWEAKAEFTTTNTTIVSQPEGS